MIEVRQDVYPATVERVRELAELNEPGRRRRFQHVDELAQPLPREPAVFLTVGRDDLLIDPPRSPHIRVLRVSEHPFELRLLFLGQERFPGAQDPAHLVERIATSPAMPEGFLLDSLPDSVEHVAGELDDVEGIHHLELAWFEFRSLYKDGTTMPSKYDPELRQRALRMLAEARPEHESLTAACRHVGGLLGVSPETLRVWQRRYDIDTGVKLGVTSDMTEENRRLRRENAELKKANEVLKAASVFFAKELDRPRTK